MKPESDRLNRAMALLAIVISCCALDFISSDGSVIGIVMSMIGR